MSERWIVPTEEQRAAWVEFRRRCVARGGHDPGVCPEKWPADPAFAERVVRILAAASMDEASLKELAETMGGPGAQ